MEFSGLYTAIITPFLNDYFSKINFNRLEKQLDRQIEAGANIVVCGTTGESPTLKDFEHQEMISFVTDYVDNRVQVIAGTGSNDTDHAMEMSEYAAKVGVDGLLVVTPYYNKPTSKGLLDYFGQINEIGLPIIAYNVPSRTGCNLDVDRLELLADKCEYIVGVKEASGDIVQIKEIADRLVHNKSRDFCLLSGDDAMTLDLVSCGGHGVISVVSNLVPKKMKEFVDLAMSEDYKNAHQVNNYLKPLFESMFIETNPQPVKTAMKLMELDTGLFRSPMVEMEYVNKIKLEKVLREYQLV
jgi:4-hydroxy-tetrahydrodipicolinate synthase